MHFRSGEKIIRYIGATPATEADNAAGEGPVFLHGDPEAERLLYARARWKLSTLPDVPPAFPAVGPAVPPFSVDDRHRAAGAWLEGWERHWRSYASAHDGMNTGGLALSNLLGVAKSPRDWAEGMPALQGLGTWRLSLRYGELANDPVGMVATSCAAAYDRGVTGVYVLPVEGEWSERIARRLLLISPAVYNSADLLKVALNDF